jgi:hypothetical protein
MIAQEDVLAVHAAVVAPPLLGLLDGASFGMMVDIEGVAWRSRKPSTISSRGERGCFGGRS